MDITKEVKKMKLDFEVIDKYIYTKGQMESALRVILRTYFNIGNDENFSHCPIFTMQSVLRNSHEAAYIEGRESALINKESDIESVSAWS
jgi:hypothetical protein